MQASPWRLCMLMCAALGVALPSAGGLEDRTTGLASSARVRRGGSAREQAVMRAPGEVVIVTCVRQEDEFVVEWLNYHLWLGFDHVYIFSQDDDPEHLRPLLAPYLAENLVTLRPWRIGDQRGALLHFLDHEQVEGQAVFFTDMDEFLVLCQHATVQQLLAEFGGARTCLQFRWLKFGTSFLATHPAGGSVLTHYHLRDGRTGQLGKVAIRSPLQPRVRASVHHRCPRYESPIIREMNMTVARLHHYPMRGGLEAYKRRVARGAAGNFGGQRQYSSRRVQDDEASAVSDWTMASILSEFPGLMTPEPPAARRRPTDAPTQCQEGVRVWDPSPELRVVPRWPGAMTLRRRVVVNRTRRGGGEVAAE